MDILQAVRRMLEDQPRAVVEDFAGRCGVPYHTLRKIVSGETRDPGYLTVLKLHAGAQKRKCKRSRRAVVAHA